MDVLLTPGFAHISSYIFSLLDTPSLCKCKLTCKSWKNFIVTQKFYFQIVNQTIVSKIRLDSEEWLTLFRKLDQSSLYENTQMLAEILIEFYSVEKVIANLSHSLTPLTICVKYGHFEHVQFLLDHLEDKNPVIDHNRQTVLHLAVALGRLEIVDLMAQVAKLESLKMRLSSEEEKYSASTAEVDRLKVW